MGRGTASPTGRSLSALHLMQRQTGHASSNRQFVASIGAQLPWHAPLEMHNGLLACPATTGADNAIGRRPARAQRRVYARALPTQLVRGSPCPSAFNVPVAQQHGNRPLMPLTALQCRSATAKDGPHKGRTDDPYRGREAAARQGYEESIWAYGDFGDITGAAHFVRLNSCPLLPSTALAES